MFSTLLLGLLGLFTYASISNKVQIPFFKTSTQITLFYHLITIIIFIGIYYLFFKNQTQINKFEGLDSEESSLLDKAIFYGSAIHCGTGFADIQPRGGLARITTVIHILISLILTLNLLAESIV
jgi:hypothetical protein